MGYEVDLGKTRKNKCEMDQKGMLGGAYEKDVGVAPERQTKK